MIQFRNYISDRPGYAGPMHADIEGARLTVVLEGRFARTAVADFGQPLPQVTSCRDATPEDIAAIYPLLDEVTRDNYESPEFIEPRRVKLLAFADGATGALLVHGEPEFWSIVYRPHNGPPFASSIELPYAEATRAAVQ